MAATNSAQATLYDRLGGYDVIAKIVGELHQRLSSDRHTWYHWKGRSTDDKAAECRSYIDLLCDSAGIPVVAQGPGTKPRHKGMGIGKVEWEHFVSMAGETLEESGLTDRDQEELFSLLARTKSAISGDGQALSPLGVFAVFPHQLTQREREVLRLVALGKNNPEIAGELFISINTVTRHITNIFTKTSTRNRVQAAVYAARRHMV